LIQNEKIKFFEHPQRHFKDDLLATAAAEPEVHIGKINKAQPKRFDSGIRS